MKIDDYIPQNIIGTKEIIKHTLYQPLIELDLDSVYFLLNIQNITTVKVPQHYKNVIISFHTEYYNYFDLLEFFKKYSDINFLLLSDGNPSNIWPENVTYAQWISYGYQLEQMNEMYGHCQKQHPKTRLFSSLSLREEFHKSAITAYLINEYPDSLISWHAWSDKQHYWKQEGYYIPDVAEKYLSSPAFNNIGTITIDSFNKDINSPMNNGQWSNPAYLNCEFNLTNESIYNTEFDINIKGIYTTPYLTEKTWKPLLAKQPFLPVGQANTLSFLTKLGMKFDYGFDLKYDSIQEDFTRLENLFKLLDELKNIDDFTQARNSAEYNLEMIISGDFNKNCVKNNILQLKKIKEWYERT